MDTAKNCEHVVAQINFESHQFELAYEDDETVNCDVLNKKLHQLLNIPMKESLEIYGSDKMDVKMELNRNTFKQNDTFNVYRTMFNKLDSKDLNELENEHKSLDSPISTEGVEIAFEACSTSFSGNEKQFLKNNAPMAKVYEDSQTNNSSNENVSVPVENINEKLEKVVAGETSAEMKKNQQDIKHTANTTTPVGNQPNRKLKSDLNIIPANNTPRQDTSQAVDTFKLVTALNSIIQETEWTQLLKAIIFNTADILKARCVSLFLVDHCNNRLQLAVPCSLNASKLVDVWLRGRRNRGPSLQSRNDTVDSEFGSGYAGLGFLIGLCGRERHSEIRENVAKWKIVNEEKGTRLSDESLEFYLQASRFDLMVNENSLVGSTAIKGETINISRATNDSRFNPVVDEVTGFQTEAVMCTPVKNSDGNVIAVLQVLNKQNLPSFTASDQYCLETLASCVGSVLKRVNRESKLGFEQLRATELVRQVQSLAQSHTTTELGQQLSSILQQCFNAKQVVLYFRRRNDRHFQVIDSEALQESVWIAKVKDELEPVIANSARVRYVTTQLESVQHMTTDKKENTNAKTVSVLAVPVLNADGYVIGAIQVFSNEVAQPIHSSQQARCIFNQDDEESLAILADATGAVLANAFSMENEMLHSNLFNALFAIVDVSNRDQEKVELPINMIKRIQYCVQELLNAQDVTVLLVNSSSKTLRRALDGENSIPLAKTNAAGYAAISGEPTTYYTIAPPEDQIEFDNPLEGQPQYVGIDSICCIPVQDNAGSTFLVIQVLNKMENKRQNFAEDTFLTRVKDMNFTRRMSRSGEQCSCFAPFRSNDVQALVTFCGQLERLFASLAANFKMLAETSGEGHHMHVLILEMYSGQSAVNNHSAVDRVAKVHRLNKRGSEPCRSSNSAVSEKREHSQSFEKLCFTATQSKIATKKGEKVNHLNDKESTEIATVDKKIDVHGNSTKRKFSTGGSLVYSFFGELDEEQIDDLMQWDFNLFNHCKEDLCVFVEHLIVRQSTCVDEYFISMDELKKFVTCVCDSYQDVPFHSFYHGFSVFHQACLIIRGPEVGEVLESIDKFAILLAALCHDIDHNGRTNKYEMNSLSPYAIMYSDHAVLERHHCHIAIDLLLHREGTSILRHMKGTDELKVLHRLIIDFIMGTDMATHFDHVRWISEEFDQFKKYNTDAISLEKSRRSTIKPFKKSFKDIMYRNNNKRERIIDSSSEAKRKSLGSAIVHLADLSGQTCSRELALEWGKRVAAEFRDQAKLEAQQNLDVTVPIIDSEVELAHAQNFFCEEIVEPLWRSASNLISYLRPRWEILNDNINYYKNVARDLEDLEVEVSNGKSPLLELSDLGEKEAKFFGVTRNYDGSYSHAYSPKNATSPSRGRRSRGSSEETKRLSVRSSAGSVSSVGSKSSWSNIKKTLRKSQTLFSGK